MREHALIACSLFSFLEPYGVQVTVNTTMTPKMSQMIARGLMDEPCKLIEKLALALQSNDNLAQFLVEDVNVPNLTKDEIYEMVRKDLAIYNPNETLVSVDTDAAKYELNYEYDWRLCVPITIEAYYKTEEDAIGKSWEYDIMKDEKFSVKGERTKMEYITIR